jgi:serine/threonine protein kinase
VHSGAIADLLLLGSVASLLKKFGPFHLAVVRTYTRHMLTGLDYLHLHGIVHRDIKGPNLHRLTLMLTLGDL